MFEYLTETVVMLAGIVSVLIGSVIMLIEHKQKTPNKKTFGIILLMVGLMTSIGTYCSSIDDSKKNQEIKRQTQIIDSLSKENLKFSTENSYKLDTSLYRLIGIINNSEKELLKLDDVHREMERRALNMINYFKKEWNRQFQENRRIRYPMPQSVYVSFELELELSSLEKQYYAKLMETHPNVLNPIYVGFEEGKPKDMLINYYPPDRKDFLNLNQLVFRMTLSFSKGGLKTRLEEKMAPTYWQVLHVRNKIENLDKDLQKIQLSYSPKDTTFLMYFSDIELSNTSFSNSFYDSLIDLYDSDFKFYFDWEIPVKDLKVAFLHIRTDTQRLCSTSLEKLNARTFYGESENCSDGLDFLNPNKPKLK